MLAAFDPALVSLNLFSFSGFVAERLDDVVLKRQRALAEINRVITRRLPQAGDLPSLRRLSAADRRASSGVGQLALQQLQQVPFAL
jgi:hypothetical protein